MASTLYKGVLSSEDIRAYEEKIRHLEYNNAVLYVRLLTGLNRTAVHTWVGHVHNQVEKGHVETTKEASYHA